MAKLAARHCTTLPKGTRPIRETVARALLHQLNPAWQMSKNKQAIQRKFQFADFQHTVSFVNAVAWIANRENHHPDLKVTYNCCEVSYTSHIASGLTVNDFICAARTDSLFRKERATIALDNRTENAADTTKPTQDNKQENSLIFNAAEADALLRKQEKAKEPAVKIHEDIDEFELIDPDERAPAKQGTATKSDVAAAQVIEPRQTNTEKPAIAKTKVTDSEKPTENLSTSGTVIDPDIANAGNNIDTPRPITANIDLMSTVILPPETVSSYKPVKDLDEDSTVILPDTTATAEIDDHAVMGLSSEEDIEDTLINDKPPEYDDDIDRTMILAPQQIEKITAVVKAGEVDNLLENGKAFDAKASSEEDVEKTMVLRSDPTNAIRRQPIPQQETKQPESHQQEKASGGEENAEKTIALALNSDPTNASQRQPIPISQREPKEPENQQHEETSHGEENTEKTLALTSDPTNAVKRQTESEVPIQNNSAKEQHEPDPGIEDDETLVMHSNTYKSVRRDPK